MNAHSAESDSAEKKTSDTWPSAFAVELHHDFLVYRKANCSAPGNKPEEYSDEEQTID
jgi:hypothetical protein